MKKAGSNLIETLRKGSRKLSIGKKVIISYVFLILIPACALMYLYYVRTSNIIEKEVTSALLQALKQAEINISYRLDTVRDVSNSVFMNSSLHEYLSRSEDSDSVSQQIDDIKELRKVIASAQTNADVFRVRLFVDKNKIYSGEKVNFFSLEDIKDRDWYNDVVAENGRVYWKSTYLENYLGAVESDIYVISCVRAVKHPRNYDIMAGVLVIDIPEKNISNILSGIDITGNGSVYIVDQEGKVVSHLDKSKIGTSILTEESAKGVFGASEGIYQTGKGKDGEYIIFKTIGTSGWKIVAHVPVTGMNARNTTFNNASGVITIIMTLIVFMLAVLLILAFLTEGMNRRIKQLVGMMKKEGIESLDEGLPVKDGDMYKLEKSIDSMIKAVRNLMEESYQAKMHEREAQLKALQAQINPHFLYNTLDTINWMAIKRNAEDISFMLDSLAKYFRLSLNKGKDIVSVGDELNLAKVYLDIQTRRFIDSFDYHFDINEEVSSFQMPKLTLQPIIENALLHGIQKKRDRKGTIVVGASKVEDDVIITVSDDGVGIEKTKLEELLAGTLDSSQPSTRRGSYGLYNVNERLKLFSGDGYGMKISSEVGIGTRVEIRLKALLQD